jgi:hypothetical protein
MSVSHVLLFTHTLRTFGFDGPTYWRDVIAPAGITALIPAGLGMLLSWVAPPVTWLLLLTECAAAAAVYALAYWLIGFSKEERIDVVSQATALIGRWR